MKFILALTLILVSCTKKVDFDTRGVTPSLKEVHWEISNVNEGTWAVGILWRDIVSKNLTVILTLPVMRNSDLDLIEKNYGVDSWLVRVNHRNRHGQKSQLSTLLAPLRSQIQGSFTSNQTRSIAFSLTYAAWAMSERFRKFQCPSFSHRARLKHFEVHESNQGMEFNLSSIGKFNESYTINELVPPKLIIAESMVGDFYLEAALFNTKTKTLYSSFQQIPTYLSVTEEKQIDVTGCSGVQQEYQR